MAKDFFISYSNADRAWAEWIAWTVEEAGYSVMIQAWDFRPGSNFVVEMARAAQAAVPTIVLLSPDYLNSTFTREEWEHLWRHFGPNDKRAILPVRVRKCDPRGALASL